MKKIIAVILALCVALSLAACGNSDPAKSSDVPNDTAPATANPSSDGKVEGTAFTGEIGMFDPDYDYSQNPKYKFQYVSHATSPLVESFSDSLGQWAEQMNLDYLGMVEFGGDSDAFLSMLPTLAQEADGLIIDPDPMLYPRVVEIMEESGTPWMAGQAAPRDYESPNMDLLHPFVGFNDYQVGSIFPEQLLAMKEQMWPDVPLSEFGFITVDFSIVETFRIRAQGCHDALEAIAPELMDRYFVADTSINIFDVDTSNQVVSSVLSRNPDIKYWLVYGELDDMAKGAAAALDSMGLADTSLVSSFGGPSLVTQWNAGVETAWRTSSFLPTAMYTEPILCGLYAFMNGDATPDTLWPDWVNVNDCGGEGHSYPSRMIPCFWITIDNYQEICKWGDVYAGTNNYPNYPSDGITRDTYSAKLTPPESYKE